MKPARPARATPPIINFGKLRVDFPSRARPLKDNLKFVAFVIVLLLLFVVVYRIQERWLTSLNEKEYAPQIRATAAP